MHLSALIRAESQPLLEAKPLLKVFGRVCLSPVPPALANAGVAALASAGTRAAVPSQFSRGKGAESQAGVRVGDALHAAMLQEQG